MLFRLRKIEGKFKRYFINLFGLDREKRYTMIKNTILLIKVYIIVLNPFNPL